MDSLSALLPNLALGFQTAVSLQNLIYCFIGVFVGTLVGAVLGAFLVNWGKTTFTSVLPDFWLFALGGLFVAVTLFLPKGIVGLVNQFDLRRMRHGPLKFLYAGKPS